MKLDDPIALEVRCRACGQETAHEVGAVLYDAAPVEAGVEDAWSEAIYVPLSLVCPACGAVDSHEVLPEAGARVAALAAEGAEAESATVREGRAALSDGTPIRTPTEGLARLRAQAEAAPTDALGWRRLGNFAVRAGRHDEAMAAFRRGAAIEGELECAIAVAVDEVTRETDQGFEALARAVSRLVHAEPQRRPLQAAQLAEALRRLGRGHLHVAGGALAVAEVRDWSRLGELLASRRVEPSLALEASAPPIDLRAALARA